MRTILDLRSREPADSQLFSIAVPEMDQIALTRLRADGQRLTSGRQLILKALAELDEPVTIPALLQRQPSLAQSSVYRNLAILEQAGLVSRIAMGDEHAHFELAEELTNHHHHHLVCSACGRVRDVTLAPRTERALDKALAQAAEEADFELRHHRLDLVGHCGDCVRG